MDHVSYVFYEFHLYQVTKPKEIQDVISSNKEENAILLVICCLTIAWKMRIRSFNVELFVLGRRNYGAADLLLKLRRHDYGDYDTVDDETDYICRS
ncbi:hypothetical protein CsSME_00006099 [Camellia sinensis var. sinensis]